MYILQHAVSFIEGAEMQIAGFSSRIACLAIAVVATSGFTEICHDLEFVWDFLATCCGTVFSCLASGSRVQSVKLILSCQHVQCFVLKASPAHYKSD